MEQENTKRACLAILIAFSIKKKGNKRRLWSKNWYKERNKYRSINLLDSIRLYKELDDFENYFRMPVECFDHILGLVSPFLTKKDTMMRDAISAKEKLALTLHYLATGSYFMDVRLTAIMSRQSISDAVMDTCEALIYVLRNYIKMPSTADEWRSVAEDFRTMHNFHNCLGAVDGKHIKIKRPSGSGSLYYNYKGTYSIVLMAIANAKKEFIMIDVGCNGRVSDGGVLYYTKFYERLQQNSLNLPEPTTLPNSSESYPYIFVGDEAFALGPNFMKPYPQKRATDRELLYNQRLSKARCVIECSFGIVASKFGVFQKAISLSPEKASKITAACCYLHNYLISKGGSQYVATNGNNLHLTDMQGSSVRNSTECAKTIRDKFRDYYNDE